MKARLNELLCQAIVWGIVIPVLAVICLCTPREELEPIESDFDL